MQLSEYEAIAQEGEDDMDERAPSSSLRGNAIHPTPIKPETYYGEGTFDPPSSDEEADELLEKGGRESSEQAERAGMRSAMVDGGTLLVGIRKARVSQAYALVQLLTVFCSDPRLSAFWSVLLLPWSPLLLS